MRVLERRDGGAFSDMWLPSAVLTGIDQCNSDRFRLLHDTLMNVSAQAKRQIGVIKVTGTFNTALHTSS